MVAFYLGIILGVLGGYLFLVLLSGASLAQEGEKDKVHAESLIFAAADSYHGAPLGIIHQDNQPNS